MSKNLKINSAEDEFNWYKRSMVGAPLPDEELMASVLDLRARKKESLLKLVHDRYRNADLQDFGYDGDVLASDIENLFTEDSEFCGIILSGRSGNGKTHALNAIVNYMAERDPSKVICFENYSQFVQELREEFSNGSYVDLNSLWNICYERNRLREGLVILDDVGTSKFSDFEMEKLYMILDSRTSNYQPTILSTNVPPEDFQKTFGERIASRLKYFKVVKLKDDDYRQNEN